MRFDLRVVALCALAIPAFGCHGGHQSIAPAIACTDPCCGGDPASIDCAENPDLQCIEPDDACPGGRTFGCMGGTFFLSALDTCQMEAGTEAGPPDEMFVVPPADAGPDAAPDAGPDASPDAAQDAAADAVGPADAAMEAGMDATTAGDATTDDGSVSGADAAGP